MSIRIGIAGYGNLGRGVECAIRKNPDMELKAVFTRRDPASVSILTQGVPVYSMEKAPEMKGEIDVLILCGGSATDLPVQTPAMAQYFNVVDSFDTHAKIPEHFEAVDKAAKAAGKIAVISAGWDPGMFSLNRLYANAILTDGKDYTFWGKGVSQGHSDAIRRIEGVQDARQYTIPVESAMEAVRAGKEPELSTRESTPACAMWWQKREPTRPALKMKSRPCPTISAITTPPSTSFLRKSWIGTIRDCLTADVSFAAVKPAGKTSIIMSSSIA